MNIKNFKKWLISLTKNYKTMTYSEIEASSNEGDIIVYTIMINPKNIEKKIEKDPDAALILDLQYLELKEISTLLDRKILKFMQTFSNCRSKTKKEISEESPDVTNTELERLVKVDILKKEKVVNRENKRNMNLYVIQHSVIFLRTKYTYR